MNLAKQWTTDPAIVEIESVNVASDMVEQHVYAVAGADKYKLLFNLVNDNGWERVIVFANRKDEVGYAMRERLLPLATIATPNLPEARILAELPEGSADECGTVRAVQQCAGTWRAGAGFTAQARR